MKTLQNFLLIGLCVTSLGASPNLISRAVAQVEATPELSSDAGLARAEELNSKVRELYQQGRYGEAIPLAQEVLLLRETTLGENHPAVATSLNNLAGLYEEQGNYTAALPLYEQALSIRETALGEEHPTVATSLNNLATLYQVQGDYTAALPLHEQALSIRETV